VVVYVAPGKASGLRQVIVLAGDGGAVRDGPGREELRDVVVVEVHEEPTQRQREEIRPQQAAGVDDGEPRLADTPGRGEATRREAAEHVR
jgi:hypothetical protein